MERYRLLGIEHDGRESASARVVSREPNKWGVFPLHTFNSGDEVVLAADAQATIAALEQRVKELKQWVQDQSTANLETMRHTDEMQSRALEAEQQLTQRTAELEAANGSIEAARQVNNDLQAELERVRALIKAYADAKIDFDDKRLQEDHHAWKERYNKLVEAENALLQHRQGMEG